MMENNDNKDDNNKEEMIKVLYNCCYGGWSMSDKAKKLYRLRREEPDYINHDGYGRSDPVLVQIFEELGKEFNGRHCEADIELIPKKYEHHYHISEYDGLESVDINIMGYKFHVLKENTKSILKSNMTDSDKIASLNKLFLDPIKKDEDNDVMIV